MVECEDTRQYGLIYQPFDMIFCIVNLWRISESVSWPIVGRFKARNGVADFVYDSSIAGVTGDRA